jgi:outer membrane lipoprotein-sorting protein
MLMLQSSYPGYGLTMKLPLRHIAAIAIIAGLTVSPGFTQEADRLTPPSGNDDGTPFVVDESVDSGVDPWVDPDLSPDLSNAAQPLVSLQEIEDYLQSLSQIQAQFILIGPDYRTSRGTFSLSKPGRIRFEYDPPDELLIVSDGKVISLVDYDLRQVTRWPIKKTPLRPLVRSGEVFGEDVTVTRMVQQGDQIRVLIAEAGDEDDGAMELVFRQFPLRLKGWEIIDGRDNRTIIVLENLETDVDLADSLWTFKDPRPKRRSRPGR